MDDGAKLSKEKRERASIKHVSTKLHQKQKSTFRSTIHNRINIIWLEIKQQAIANRICFLKISVISNFLSISIFSECIWQANIQISQ